MHVPFSECGVPLQPQPTCTYLYLTCNLSSLPCLHLVRGT